jgi:hypothetical protein
MLAYWLIFGLLALGALFGAPGERRQRPLLWAMGVLLVLFVGLRFEVGADWPAYEYIYDIADMSYERFAQRGDFLFSSIVWLLRNNGYNYWALNLVCAAIFLFGLIVYARRLPNPWLAVAVAFPYLILVVGMSGIRQSAAIGLLFLALGAFFERRFALAALFLMVGSLFHSSVIIVLGLAAVAISTNRVVGVVILALTVLVGIYVLGSDFNRIITRYGTYTVESSGIYFRLVMNLIPAALFLGFRKRLPIAADQRSFWSILAYLSIAFIPLSLLIESTTALDRFSLYVIPLQMFMLSWVPYVAARNPDGARMIVLATLGYLALVLFVFLNFSTYAEKWIPYQSVLFTREA